MLMLYYYLHYRMKTALYDSNIVFRCGIIANISLNYSQIFANFVCKIVTEVS